VRFEFVYLFESGIVEHLNGAQSRGEEKVVSRVVPADFVDFELELFLGLDLERFAVDEGDEIVLVSHRDRLSLGRPRDVQILALCGHRRGRLSRTDVPNPNGFVSRCGGEELRIGWMPNQLVDRVPVTFVAVLFDESVFVQGENAGGFV